MAEPKKRPRISREDALEALFKLAEPVGTETVPAETCCGRVLAEDLRCAPRFDFLNLVEVLRDGDKYYVEPRDRGKTPLPVILKSNALFVSPAGEGFYAAGRSIEVELLRDRSLLPPYEGKKE